MVMWIVLGSLIGVVVIFLVVTSTLDRKKSKKLKVEKETLSKEIFSAGTIISKEVTEAVTKNATNVKSFVPSVGKLKMSEINKVAKDELKVIRNSKNFKLLKHNEDQFNLFSNNINALISEKSNNWAKRNQENIKFFVQYQPPKQEVPETKKTKKSKKAKPEVTIKKTKKSKKAKPEVATKKIVSKKAATEKVNKAKKGKK